MDETNATEPTTPTAEPTTPDHVESTSPGSSEVGKDAAFEAWINEPVPQHAAEAIETYFAELDELLAHLAANPQDRCVAYRGRQRLGFGTDDLTLYQACLAKFPDRQFCIYGIDAAARSQDVVVGPCR